MRALSLTILLLALAACDGGTPPAGEDGGPRPRRDAGMPLPPGDGCTSVRLTNYTAGPSGWCELPRDLPFLPAFVRDEGLTTAIAEPWAGGSYGGETGEACGECWEVDTLGDTRTVMVMDLCPNEGNPLCQGAHFHLDISSEASAILNAGFLDEAQARRVPCPVEGNVHVFVNDENFSYLRLQFANHRVPVRAASIRSTAPGSPQIDLRRSGGAWEAVDDEPLDRGGEGVVFTIESAQGERLESSVVVPTHPPRQSSFDLGVQFTDRMPPEGGACVFVPPAVIFDDEFGGIDEVRWQIDPWGEAEGAFFGPTGDGCFAGECLRIERLGQFSGFHLYYRGAFPSTTFAMLRMRLRASEATMLVVAPSHEGTRCDQTMVAVGTEWAEVSIDVRAVCGGLPQINAVTVDNPGSLVELRLDDVRFEP